MATHSKIRPFRALTHPLSQQNRHNLGHLFPLTHPCVRPHKRKRTDFTITWGSHSNLSFAHLTVICVAVVNFRSPPLNDLLSVYHVTQPSNGSTSPDNQRPHRTFPLVYPQDFIYKSVTYIKKFLPKNKRPTEDFLP